MKLYKNTYDLKNNGEYQPRQINVPTDSKFAVAVRLMNDGTPVEMVMENATLVRGDEVIEASDVYHNFAVFEMESTSDEKDDKTYSFRYIQLAEYDNTFVGNTGDALTGAGTIYITERLGTIPANLNDLNFELHIDGSQMFVPMPTIDISGKMNEIVVPTGFEFPTIHNQVSKSFMSNKSLSTRGDKTTMYFVGKDATTGNVGWVNYKTSYEKSGQNITEKDFLTDYSPETLKLFFNPLYQGCPYTLTLRKGETLIARFDNLVINQKDENAGSVEPVITDIEVDSVSANSIEVENLVYDASNSTVKFGEDVYKLEAKTIDDAECLVLVKQVEEA